MATENLQETTSFLLAQTCKLFRGRALVRLEEIGLYRGQQFVLSVLWEHEGITHSQLAEQLRVRPATITNGLKRMEKAGLVERRPDARDQRVSRVYLTDSGRAIRATVEATWHELDRQVFAGFSQTDRAHLGRLLLRIQENLLAMRAQEGSGL